MTTRVIAVGGADAAAARLAACLGGTVCPLAQRRFPDGEHYLRVLGAVEGADVVLVAHLHPVDPLLVDIVFLADALRELGARQVGLVVPYLAYMRQDRRFQPGEAVTSVSFARLLSRSVDWLATVDPHLHRHAALSAIYSVPALAVPSAPAIARWIRAEVPDAVVVGPDEESGQWVDEVARLAGCPGITGRKLRHGDRSVEIAWPALQPWRGRPAVLVDDIVSSGQTLVTALQGLGAQGLQAAACVVVHGLFAHDAAQRLQAAGASRLVVCNTLPQAGLPLIDVLGDLAEAAARLIAPRQG